MNNLVTISATRCEINVTPLIDILLVLLIVFMIITPLTPRGLPGFVPQESAAHEMPNESPVFLEVRADRTVRLNGLELSAQDLEFEMGRMFSTHGNEVLFIEGDQNLEYRDIARLIDLARGVDPGIQVGLVSPADSTSF